MRILPRSRRASLFVFLAIALPAADRASGQDAAAPASVPHWIWQGDKPSADQTVFFRKEFDVPRGRIGDAKLYATCDNQLEVFVNGQSALEHDEWESPAVADVGSLLKSGRNVLAVRGRNREGAAALLVKLVIEQRRSGKREVVTDDTWRVSAEGPDGWQQPDFDASAWASATVLAKLGEGPWRRINEQALLAAANLREPTATPIEQIKAAKGFQVELLYTVPKDQQGSWVNMCVDPRGRLIVSDQYGGLFQVTPPALGGSPEDIGIEPLDVDIGEAQGLLWAFDSLYVVVNRGGRYDSGLYRVKDTDGDGELDRVELLRRIDGSGEHGPHAVLLSPDGQSLTIVCGNGTRLPHLNSSRVPRVWDEDILLPRLYGRGFMKGVPAPAGFIAQTDPDGKTWELLATGFRNEYDAAWNRDGELFAYDADMEWDFNTPWYRPTRINHVVSGAEFGWRNGSAKWPPYYFDSVPAAVEIGPGSPTGVCFGYGAKFPQKYQDALFCCDWSYGKLYAVHLEPQGASYGGTFEELVAGTPLPLTDVVINPQDGAMYFTIGGRRVQSGLYRVTYTGDGEQAESREQRAESRDAVALRALRHELESLHQPSAGAVDKAWPYLKHPDRSVRYAARTAIEHQPLEEWAKRAFNEADPQASLCAMLALVRQQKRAPALRNDVHDPVLPTYDEPLDLTGVDQDVKLGILQTLSRLDWNTLTYQQRIDLLRVYTITFARLGRPERDAQGMDLRQVLIDRFDSWFPAGSPVLNEELCRLLVYLQAPGAAAKSVELLAKAPTQEEQIAYAAPLRYLRAGWTDELRRDYFAWFPKAATYRGGANFTMFLDELKKDAIALLTEDQKLALKEILEAAPVQAPVIVGPPRSVVKEWRFDELLPIVSAPLKDRSFERGREMFGAAKCFACHRFNNEGGAMGPDLTVVSGRFSPRDLLESIVEPSKVISDQYAATQFLTTEGQVIVGRIINLGGDTFQVNTDMLDPNALRGIDRRKIEEMQPSKVSMMPHALLNTLHKEEIVDLFAYLLSRGDASSPIFAQSTSSDPDAASVRVAAPAAADHEVPPLDNLTPLFNGKDLAGWHGMPHFDPRELPKLSDDEREAKIAEWTQDAKKHWTVENGELVNDGEGAYLTTDEDLGDVLLTIDYKTVAKADSGIYLRANPQVQIWDWTEEGGKWDLGADKGSGGLWNNSAGTPGKDPSVLADRPFGEWNAFVIRQVGARTSVWLNGYNVVDHAILENFWDKSKPLPRTGSVQLQTHGGEIRWRNIAARPIPAEEANRILRERTGDGFTPLFNGSDLTGWKGAVENYEVVDGAIRCKDGHGGVLHTQDEYGDFEVRLDIKLPTGGNNGLAIRYPGEGDPAYTGMCELQVLDTEHEKYGGLDPRQAHGSAYAMVPAHRGCLRPAGEWNFQHVTVKGSTIKVELNGFVILDTDLSKVTEFMGGRPHPGKDRTQGFFGFAGHSDPVEFRDIEIRAIAPDNAASANVGRISNPSVSQLTSQQGGRTNLRSVPGNPSYVPASWPQFRGHNASGHPAVDRRLPPKIAPDASVVWKIDLPPGHSSPVVFGDRIYLTAIHDGRLLTLALDRGTGAVLWERDAPHDAVEQIHQIGSVVQSSPATDGEHVVSFFGSCGLFCYAADGTFLWQRPMGPFKNGFGAGSSPIIVDDRVILSQDHDTDSFIAAYDIDTGSTLWETDRSEFPRNYCTPVVWEVDGRKQLVVVATLRAVGYDFDSGDEVWTVRGLSRFVCPTPVVGDDGTLYLAAWARGAEAGERIEFAPFDEKRAERDADGDGCLQQPELAAEKGGDLERRFDLIDRDKDGSITRAEYEEFRMVLATSENAVVAVRPGGRGDITDTHVAWRFKKHVPFVASPLLVNRHLFSVKDGGVLTTLVAATGEPVKTARISGTGAYYASPVVGDGKVYLVDEQGRLTIVNAVGEWQVLAEADFGENVYATPAIVDGRIYFRTAGHLYCFGS